MNNKLNNSIVYVKEKKSGFLWVALGFVLLIAAIPLMIYGLGKASYNGVVWIGQHPSRKLAKLERKQRKIETKQSITELRDTTKAYKQAKKQTINKVEGE